MTLDPDVAVRLGRELRAGRLITKRSQQTIGASAGVSQPVVSRMELGRGGGIDLDTWAAVAAQIGMRLEIDIVSDDPAGSNLQERCHATVTDLARTGGWSAATTIRRCRGEPDIQTVLRRPGEAAVVQVWDHVTQIDSDLGRFEDSVVREADDDRRVSGFLVIPATGSNRRRVTEVRGELQRIFTARARDWFAALVNSRYPMPIEPGILWSFPDGRRLRPATLWPGWIWTAVGDGPRFATGRRDPARRRR